MTRSLSIHGNAEAEINEAADFYDLECLGLGTAFLDEIQRAINHIHAFPDSSPCIRGRILAKTVGRFPYSLMYSIVRREIRILAVAHQKRRPFYWHGRG